MKHFLLLFLLVSSAWLRPLHARAQAAGTDSLNQKLTRIFAPLDKTQVPAPYLAEYSNRFTSLTPFNDALTDSSVATLTAWRLLYASVLSGNVGRPSPPMGNIFNEDFGDFLEALHRNKVRYVLVGGYSVILHGYSRTTGVLDI